MYQKLNKLADKKEQINNKAKIEDKYFDQMLAAEDVMAENQGVVDQIAHL